ncbi:MAG: RNA polymerase sigma-54 factor [Chloroflexi bacterium]|nr:RNA polymerase sigma-54 factor [Chloroflexota bacterium]
MFQVQKQVLRPQVTAHLAQTMALLEMTREEIQQKVNAELANNPALEIIEERRCPSCGRTLSTPGPCPICSQPYDLSLEEPIVFMSPQDDFRHQSGSKQNYQNPNDYSHENYVPQEIDLPTFILRQIAPDLKVEERPIAAHILNSLDEDGLLSMPLEEIGRFLHIPLKKVKKVAKIIQGAEPIGVGSSSPQEVLLAQLRALDKVTRIPPPTEEVIRSGMELLSKGSYGKLAKELGTSHGRVLEAGHFIRENLTPYPARANWGNIRQGSGISPQVYHHPDVIIREQENSPKPRLIVEIITPYRGMLRVNPLFRKALEDENNKACKKTLEQASLLIKCLQQRNNTMGQLMATIAKLQREFLLTGDKANLRPTTQVEMAELLDVHESTISRAVSNKSVQLPNKRIVPLKLFFDRSLPIRVTLKRIIANEKKPLSDSALADKLAEKGYPIARRTVAKYRSMEGILSSRMR